MLVIPAIDLRRGRCVRLLQGRPTDETVFSDDPVKVAQRWAQEGARRLHVVNLDGALAGGHENEHARLNSRIVAEMASSVEVPIQLGGGLHSMADIERALSARVDRVILGTAAVENPDLVATALERFGPDRILIGIDGRDGMVVTRGWQEESSVAVLELAMTMKKTGIQRIIYTDVRRDGMLVGINHVATASLARDSGLRVIASGGVRSIADIAALIPLEPLGVEGVIVGRALYTGDIDLKEATALCEDTPTDSMIQEE